MFSNCVSFPYGKMANKEEARALFFNLKKFVSAMRDGYKARYEGKKNAYNNYLNKKQSKWVLKIKRFFDDGYEFRKTRGVRLIEEEIRLLERDLESLNDALCILNTPMVVEFYVSEELCRIIAIYKDALTDDPVYSRFVTDHVEI